MKRRSQEQFIRVKLADEPAKGTGRVMAELKQPTDLTVPARVNGGAVTSEQPNVGAIVGSDVR